MPSYLAGLTCVVLVDKSLVSVLARQVLSLFCQSRHLVSSLFIGRRHQQGQEVSKRIDSDMNLTAFGPFGLLKLLKSRLLSTIKQSFLKLTSPRAWFPGTLHARIQLKGEKCMERCGEKNVFLFGAFARASRLVAA